MSNILLVMDCSNAQTEKQHVQQVNFVNELIQTWTNFERVYITCFGNGLGDRYPYGTITSRLNAENIIAQQTRKDESPNIKRLFEEMSSIESDPQLGVQHTVILSYSRGTDDAQEFAGDLMAKGSTTIIGVALDDISSLEPLASLGKTFSWNGLSTNDALIQQIIDSINQ